MSVKIIHADCLDAMRGMADASVDSVVTDPPAGISFMGRDWDHHKGGRDQWIAWMAEVAAECLRVCKPGSHALVWALPRTSHWTATAWENAGWEVRDRVSHLFGSGFPKSQNIGRAFDRAAGAEREVVGRKKLNPRDSKTYIPSEGGGYGGIQSTPVAGMQITAPATDLAKQWDGWGTALKPAMEDWWLLRRPLIGTVAANVAAHGTGALNIDGCRIGTDAVSTHSRGGNGAFPKRPGETSPEESGRTKDQRQGLDHSDKVGRWPANLCHDGSPEVLEAFARFGERPGAVSNSRPATDVGFTRGAAGQELLLGRADTGTAAWFFFSAKASREERGGSKHPTIKPLSLIRWLCRLITPPGGTILDPFAGSGTTGIAADQQGFNSILIEREAEYIADIRRRIHHEAPLFSDPLKLQSAQEQQESLQGSLLDVS